MIFHIFKLQLEQNDECVCIKLLKYRIKFLSL
jgi:hypothetical protein